MCYRLGAGTITNFVGGGYMVVPLSTERRIYTASATVTGLAPGTYTIGMGIMSDSAASVTVNNNDFVNGFVMLVN